MKLLTSKGCAQTQRTTALSNASQLALISVNTGSWHSMRMGMAA